MAAQDGTSRFQLVGGRLCLDFANTRGLEPQALDTYRDLVAWSRLAGLVSAAEARHLGREARRRPAEAGRVMAQAEALRETFYRILVAHLDGRGAKDGDLAALNRALEHALAHEQLVPVEGGFRLAVCCGRDQLDSMLWPVVTSMATLLATPAELERVRSCEAHLGGECNWVFFDDTRSRTRRWCSMDTCGNRAKARRHYARAKRPGAD